MDSNYILTQQSVPPIQKLQTSIGQLFRIRKAVHAIKSKPTLINCYLVSNDLFLLSKLEKTDVQFTFWCDFLWTNQPSRFENIKKKKTNSKFEISLSVRI